MTKPSNCLSILQLSDLHILSGPEATLLGVNTAYYFDAVLRLALASHEAIDLILLTGDLAQDPIAESYNYIVARMTDVGIPCLCLPGNHDDFGLMQTILNNHIISCAKQTVLADWQIICLNSQILGEDGGLLSAQEMAWLTHCLDTEPDKNALIAVHHHCLLTHSEWMDEMMIQNSSEFLQLIRQYRRARLVINGHIHQEQDEVVGSLCVLGVPSTCFQFKPGSKTFGLDETAPGYRLLTLYPDGRFTTYVGRLAERLVGLEEHTNGY